MRLTNVVSDCLYKITLYYYYYYYYYYFFNSSNYYHHILGSAAESYWPKCFTTWPWTSMAFMVAGNYKMFTNVLAITHVLFIKDTVGSSTSTN